MVNGRTWFPVSSGLLTWEHYQRIGSAWMVFEWMIHEQRAPKNGEENTGRVRDGEPISYDQISASLQGMPARTIEKHVAALEREHYIRSERVPRKGKRYFVTNPIRWLMVLPKNGERAAVYSPNVGSEITGSLPINGGHFSPNVGSELGIRVKEVKPKTKPKGVVFNSAEMELPEWLSRDVWTEFVEHRKETKNPLTERAARANIRKLCEFRSKGQDPHAVIDQSIAAGWTGLFEVRPGKKTPKAQPLVVDAPDPYELTMRQHLRAKAAGGNIQ
jgi:DNA-binding transcriptional ArsR family regulator